MSIVNTKEGYGALTKLFHWLIVLLFALQYVGANIMLALGRGETLFGQNGGFYYNWHKSLGLVALVIAVVRLINRQVGRLPDWAPTLTAGEQRFIHRAEQLLYLSMFVMPISGYIYVMSGGYGVLLFGVWKMDNPIGKWESLAFLTKWVHIIFSYALLAAILGHLVVVLRHQFIVKDGLIKRMLPRKGD
ncbi:cytochrome b [Actibacterium sp. 188UL27-1]|uniref:cytochrome b n=1 Tax=Actibacterium sp. 188UL27-1 TaxID=2786961 RepID=UPI00195F1A7D|nr:cytochrome b [Actibacterium sp. 188UL27-1]MBM7068470.1 cytochrome b [Actibacterium sp. 188UL27-1]